MTGNHHHRSNRPWIAMIAAYAVALQMLLSAAVASQMAAAAPSGAFPTCYGVAQPADGPDDNGLVPVHQAACVLCTVGLSAPVDLTSTAEPVFACKDVERPRLLRDAVLAQAPPSPRLSQGPPQTA